MKREQRHRWRELLGSHYVLCVFCRYGYDGRYIPDHGNEWLCTHALNTLTEGMRRRGARGMAPGDDCWGFRPEKGLTLEGARDRVREWERSEE